MEISLQQLLSKITTNDIHVHIFEHFIYVEDNTLYFMELNSITCITHRGIDFTKALEELGTHIETTYQKVNGSMIKKYVISDRTKRELKASFNDKIQSI